MGRAGHARNLFWDKDTDLRGCLIIYPLVRVSAMYHTRMGFYLVPDVAVALTALDLDDVAEMLKRPT